MRLILLVFSCLLISCNNSIDSNTIVQIKQYNGFPKQELDTVVNTIESFYGVEINVLKEQELYSSAFINVKSPRFRADSIIKFQKREINNSIDFVLGLTHKDISTTKTDKFGKTKEPKYKYQDWGIMGLAYCPGNSCIISTFRIKTKDKKQYFSRLKKVSVHEFGHNLGLKHCQDKKCVMTDAVESVKTIDNAELQLCEKCNSAIH